MKTIRTKGRGAQQAAEMLAALEQRGGAALDAVLPAVRRIVADVRRRGDQLCCATPLNSTASPAPPLCALHPARWPPRGMQSSLRCKRR